MDSGLALCAPRNDGGKLRLLLRRNPRSDRHENNIYFEGYAPYWPNGQPVALGLDALCKHGQRLLGLGRKLEGAPERLVDLICVHLPEREANLTRIPGHRVRRFCLERTGLHGRVYFLDGTPTTILFDLDRDEETFLNWLGLLLIAEFALAVLADILGRIVSLVDGLLSERVSNSSSVRLMEHAATLDLEDFEDSEFQDQLERARRQTSGRMTLMGQLLGQAQDIVTVASFVAGFIFFAPWLIALLLLALVPAFLGEAHFNAQSYSLDFGRTPERRELDYVRQTAASVETAKEVKIFNLHRLIGTAAAVWSLGTVLLSECDEVRGMRSILFRASLFVGALLIAAEGHFGGMMIHGADFLNGG